MKFSQPEPQYQKCRICDYDRNQNNAIKCEVCHFTLKQETRTHIVAIVVPMVLLVGFLTLFKQDSSKTETNSRELQQLSDRSLRQYTWMREVPNVPTGLFSYGGATCFAAMTAHGLNAAISQAHPQFHLRYTEPLNQPPGCSTGITMLLSGENSFAQNGRPLEESEYNSAKIRNFSLQQVPVAIDGIVFFIHPDLNVSGLTVTDLQDIYTGKLKNWSQLGGPNLPIVPISQNIKVHATLKLLLGSRVAYLSSNVKFVRDYTAAIRQVAATPGGISYSSAAIARSQQSVRTLALAKSGSNSYIQPFTKNNLVNVAALRDGTYPITRRLYIVIRHDGSLDEQAGVAYASMLRSQEGQQYIEKSGFAAIYLNFN